MNKKLIILNHLVATYEIVGQTISESALKFIIQELEAYDIEQIVKGLYRCRTELKFKMSLADIIERIDDGRPSPVKAWQEIENITQFQSIVLTEEQHAAFCSIGDIDDGTTGQKITAKQTFIERYKALVSESRLNRKPLNHVLLSGFDADTRKSAVIDALALGKITENKAALMLPDYKDEILVIGAATNQIKPILNKLAKSKKLDNEGVSVP